MKARFNNLYHLGVKPVARSTFADANHQRPAFFFEALLGLMYRRCQPLAAKHKFQFKNKLYSLEATVVSLCLPLFPWAACRRTKGGIKNFIPSWISQLLCPALRLGSTKSKEPAVSACPKAPSWWRIWATPTMTAMPSSPPRNLLRHPPEA